VGGGNGSESFEIAKKAPHIRIIVQDRDQTIQQVALPVSPLLMLVPFDFDDVDTFNFHLFIDLASEF
jgi:hypothetical protein